MASTEPGDERGEVIRHSAQLERYSRGVEGMSPEPPPEPEVALHIGASHVLDDLSAIEPLAGAGEGLGGVAAVAAAALPAGARSAAFSPALASIIRPPFLPAPCRQQAHHHRVQPHLRPRAAALPAAEPGEEAEPAGAAAPHLSDRQRQAHPPPGGAPPRAAAAAGTPA